MATTELEVVNAALDALGQDELSSTQYAGGTTDNALVMARQYPIVRKALLRQYPYEFAIEELPLVQVDPDGLLLLGNDDIAGAFDYAASQEYDHETAASDYYIQKVSSLWAITNAAGTKVYFDTEDDVDYPWQVTLWAEGADISDLTDDTLPRIYPGTPRDFAFLYKLPTDCLRPLKIWNAGTRRDDQQIRFKPFQQDYLVTDADDAVLRYTKDVDVTSGAWDDLFFMLCAGALALACHNKIRGVGKSRQELALDVMRFQIAAQNVDATAQHEDRTATQGRRYIDL